MHRASLAPLNPLNFEDLEHLSCLLAASWLVPANPYAQSSDFQPQNTKINVFVTKRVQSGALGAKIQVSGSGSHSASVESNRLPQTSVQSSDLHSQSTANQRFCHETIPEGTSRAEISSIRLQIAFRI